MDRPQLAHTVRSVWLPSARHELPLVGMVRVRGHSHEVQRGSPSGVRAEHTWVGSGAPAQVALRGSETGSHAMYRTRDDGAMRVSGARRAPRGLTVRMIEPRVSLFRLG